MGKAWVCVLGLLCWAGLVYGQAAANEDLAKLQSAWEATMGSSTLKMERKSTHETEIQGGTENRDPLLSEDTATVYIRNNEGGSKDMYAIVRLGRDTVTNAEMVVLNGENYVLIKGEDSEEGAEEWVSGEDLAKLTPANIDQILDPNLSIQEVEDILASENVESVLELRDLGETTSTCYDIKPTPEFAASLNEDVNADVTASNEICIDNESDKVVKVTGTIKETTTLEDQEEGAPTGLETDTSSEIIFSEFDEPFEFPARFVEEAEEVVAGETNGVNALDDHDDHDDHEDHEGHDHEKEHDDDHEDDDDPNDGAVDNEDIRNSAGSYAISSVLAIGAFYATILL